MMKRKALSVTFIFFLYLPGSPAFAAAYDISGDWTIEYKELHNREHQVHTEYNPDGSPDYVDIGAYEFQGSSTSNNGEFELTYIPAFGSHDDLQGKVSGVIPGDYKVAVYIYVPPYGWWTKPYASQPLTSIASDGTWVCDITTGGQDECATKIIPFLVPNGYDPPLGTGQQCLVYELYQYPYAEAIRYEKIRFSGYDWWVKRHCDPVGPGSNYFSDSEENVWINPNGYLHLRIAQRDGKWYCSEVIADANLGYGTYVFTVKGRVDLLDQNIVLGLFTWEDCVPEHHYREIDIEFSQWADPSNPNNAQYVVQPWGTPGNIYRFPIDCSENDITTHVFRWQPGEIYFKSYYDDFSFAPTAEDIIASWHYGGADIPPAGSENPRINFWLVDGNPPNNGQDAEIVIKNFRYFPRICNAGTLITNPVTGKKMIVVGYDDGTLEFRDWQGNVLAVRYGFGEITALEAYRCSGSPLPRLFVGSTDSGGALRIIDPANINNDVAARFGFGRITAIDVWKDCLYAGSTDSGGTLRKLNNDTLADENVRYGFNEITAISDAWDTTNDVYLLVGSTDSGGVLRCLDLNTLADYGPSPRYGFDRIYDFAAGDANGDNNAEIVIASSDSGGTVRFVESPNLTTDLATRYGFGAVYGVDYGLFGVAQAEGNGKASIVVASSDGGGSVRVMEVDAGTLATTLADSAARFGFGKIALMGLVNPYYTDVDLTAVISTDDGTVAAHIMDENLTDLTVFQIP